MLKKLLQICLRHPLSRGLDLDTPEATLRGGEIIRNKPFLKRFYRDCYLYIEEKIPRDGNGVVLEIGSGAGFLRDFIPGLVSTEILQLPTVDIVLDAQKLPLQQDSLSAIVMVDVFHHLPDVRSFLGDALSCVRPGGKIVMVEPWVTWWSSLVYRYLHHEPFDVNPVDWSFPANGPLSSSNSALSWIVFERDRDRFQKDFPDWDIEEIKLDYPISYLVSGGLSYRSLLPGNWFGFLRRIEGALHPLMAMAAMFAKITLRHK